MPKKSISLLQLNDILRDLEERNERNWGVAYTISDDDSYYVGYSDALSHIRKHLANLRIFKRGLNDDDIF